MTKIEWADTVWNPVTGCTKVSEGCRHCYAERLAKGRLRRLYPDGFETVTLHAVRLKYPLGWRRPRRIFVNSMSDLFHPAVSDEFIARTFAVMWDALRHTFIVLTKRPERMAQLTNSGWFWEDVRGWLKGNHLRRADLGKGSQPLPPVCLGNVWGLTSIEDQETADRRLPELLRCNLVVRGVSCEPLLGPIDLGAYYLCQKLGLSRAEYPFPQLGPEHRTKVIDILDWIIVGGESGPRARPCEVVWVRSAVGQCRAARVPVFVKQLGARCMMRQDTLEGRRAGDHPEREWPEGTLFSTAPGTKSGSPFWGRWVVLKNRKGGDPREWPEDLRVREWPRT